MDNKIHGSDQEKATFKAKEDNDGKEDDLKLDHNLNLQELNLDIP